VHAHFGTSLVHDCYAGAAHKHDHISKSEMTFSDPQPQTFFAPDQIKKRNADWGPKEVTRRFNADQLAFIDRAGDVDQPWMQVREHAGFKAAQTLIEDLWFGRTDPTEGHVVVLD
jgi:hypothetical protein